jgi:hypothetical protein
MLFIQDVTQREHEIKLEFKTILYKAHGSQATYDLDYSLLYPTNSRPDYYLRGLSAILDSPT